MLIQDSTSRPSGGRSVYEEHFRRRVAKLAELERQAARQLGG